MKFIDFANKAGFVLKEDFYILERNNHNLILVNYQQGYINVMGVVVCLDKGVSSEKLKQIQIETNTKKIKYLDNKNTKILLFLLDDLYGNVKEEKVNNAIEKLNLFTNVLNNNNFNKQINCIFCGKDETEEQIIYTNYNNLYLPQHLSCRNKAKEKAISNMNNENNNNKQLYPVSILLGFLGSFLAALLINILIYYVFDGTMYALMYALVPIASFFAYKLGKAPRNKYMIISVIASSVIATLFMDIVFLFIIAASVGVSLIEFLNANMVSFLAQEGMTLLFLAIGVWVSWNIISKTNDNEIKKF